jgi:Ribosomal protein L13
MNDRRTSHLNYTVALVYHAILFSRYCYRRVWHFTDEKRIWWAGLRLTDNPIIANPILNSSTVSHVQDIYTESFSLFELAAMSFPGRNLQKCWHLVDAKDQTVGRLATQVAAILKGKHKPTFKPNKDMGDTVVVINAEKVTPIILSE